MSKTWKAIDGKGKSILTIPVSQETGESDFDFFARARKEAKRQLEKPGREAYLKQWLAGGRRVSNRH